MNSISLVRHETLNENKMTLMLENSQIVNLHLSFVVQQNMFVQCRFNSKYLFIYQTHFCKSLLCLLYLIHWVTFNLNKAKSVAYVDRELVSIYTQLHSTTVILLYIRLDERTRQQNFSYTWNVLVNIMLLDLLLFFTWTSFLNGHISFSAYRKLCFIILHMKIWGTQNSEVLFGLSHIGSPK